MFKKKQTEIKFQEWTEDMLNLHYLKRKADINEFQHDQKICDNGEYLKTGKDIEDYIKQLEVRHGFDEMMGNPMEAIEGMFK